MGAMQSSAIQPYIDGSFGDQVASSLEKFHEAEYLGGYLSTLEGHLKMPKTRFYFVHDGRLYRKRKENDPLESSSIVCDLRVCQIRVSPDKHSNFIIETPAGHYVVFSAPDPHDATRWAVTLAEQAKQSLLQHGITGGVPEEVRDVMSKNPYCADCGHSSPDWVSLNLGVLICVECACIHHTLGKHISIPKCLVTSTEYWTEPALQVLDEVGNSRSNALWEYLASPRTKPAATASHETKEQWIYAKYVCHHFIDRYLTRNLRDDPSKYVFNAALRGNNMDIMRGVAGGGNVHWRVSTDSSSALHAAAQNGHVATCQLLVHLNADPAVVNAAGETPSDVASNQRVRDFFQELSQHSAICVKRSSNNDRGQRGTSASGAVGGGGADKTVSHDFVDAEAKQPIA